MFHYNSSKMVYKAFYLKLNFFFEKGGVYYRVMCSFKIIYNINGGITMKFCWIELI